MSLIPFLFDEPMVYHRHTPRYHQRGHWPMSTAFGGAFRELDDLLSLATRDARMEGSSSGARVTNKSDKFQVCMDVRGFQPNELKVKVHDKVITVEGKHEEREDEHGFITREFKRRYVIPDGVVTEQVTSSISQDGILTINAPKHQAIEAPKEVEVIIEKSPPDANAIKGNGDAK
ncbi:unnamed protein product [Cyprideis torosa]|uniref:Uncharacterized protein n=1 Tax=Cyprideis torosa TaxID=163714 RepID=A0A7R8WDT5_9CRUS|nr:unnamed protein product [Cyprideis torosa]CAG0894971.1 unnamed protein product [Cyprideis torosa]